MMVATVALNVKFTDLSSNNTFITSNAGNLSVSTCSVAIVVLLNSGNIVSINYRLVTRQLYGLC